MPSNDNLESIVRGGFILVMRWGLPSVIAPEITCSSPWM